MNLSLRYMYTKALQIDSSATLADENAASVNIEWVGVGSSRFASHSGFLYFVIDENEIPSTSLNAASAFGCVVSSSLSEKCRGIPRIVVSDSCDMRELFDYLVNEMERYRHWHDQVSDLLAANAPYQNVIDITAEFVPRPMYVADASWRMISRVDFEMGEISATWHYQMLHDGLYPYSIVEALTRTGDYHRISNLPRAQLVDSEVYTMRILAKPIRHIGKLVGYYFIIDTWGDLGYCEVEIAQEFGTMLAPLMASRNARQGNLDGFQDNFVFHMLDRMLTNKHAVAQRLRAETQWEVDSDYRLATVRFEPGELENHLLHMRTMGLLMGNFDSHAYSYKDTVLAIYREADKEHDSFLAHMRNCSSTLKRTVVLSGRFSDFSQLASYYDTNIGIHDQAGAETGKSPNVVTWDTIFPRMLANSCKDRLPLCYEAEALHAYDIAHKTNYCLTLLSYLAHERNAVAASDALFVHRNTLRNHLTRIGSIIDIDLEDIDTRMRLLISLNTLINADRATNAAEGGILSPTQQAKHDASRDVDLPPDATARC